MMNRRLKASASVAEREKVVEPVGWVEGCSWPITSILGLGDRSALEG
jgi:hypothetical protein